MIYESISKTNIITCDFSIDLNKGKTLVIVGDNGKGKTTLLRMMSGNLLPDSGRFVVDDKSFDFPIKGNYQTRFLKEIRKNVVYIENHKYLFDSFTGEQNIDYYSTLLGKEIINDRIHENLELFDIDKEDLKKKVNQLSLGTKQKISLSLAFAIKKQVILMDEPTLGLDVHSKKCLVKLMYDNRLAGGLAISTNDESFMNDHDDYLYCENGKGSLISVNPYSKS